MNTTDWKFDFSSLPEFNIRDRIPYVDDAFYDLPQNDMLCCIYSIAEVSMCNYTGYLAILKNKENPALFLNVENFCFCNNFSVSSDERFIFLQASMYYNQDVGVRRPILIIDVINSVFSYIATNNSNPCYKVVEQSQNVFRIEADEYQRKHDKYLNALSRKKIRLNRLKWYDLSELSSLPVMILSKEL